MFLAFYESAIYDGGQYSCRILSAFTEADRNCQLFGKTGYIYRNMGISAYFSDIVRK